MRAVFLLIVMTALLAGCGQKGPLYLPGDEQAAETYDPTGAAYDEQPDADQDNDTDAGDASSSGVRE
mgnify:CR=1 FL=1